jgi:hypothetical protein
MAALLSLMALAGALDPATSGGDSRAVAEVAARYLPITAGAPGWFGNILEVLGPRTAEAMPDPRGALDDILGGAYQLTVPELSRLVYVIGALSHTPAFASLVPLRDSPLAQALALAGPFYHDRDRLDVQTGENLLQLLYAEFGSAKDWDLVVRKAVALRFLSVDVAAVPRCLPSTQEVDGYDCVVIDTSFGRSDIYLENLMKVANPLNWHQNYPDAFCSMQAQNPDIFANGWSRVLESVSLGCQLGLERLVTPLKYYMSQPAPDQATLQYDLDTSGLPTLGDGKIKVDRGFIKMWATGNPGVWVRTRKIVHIEGLWPPAQALFVCMFGYAFMAAEMLFGDATDPPANSVPWQDSPGSSTTGSTGSGTGSGTTGSGTSTGPTAPAGGNMASTTTQVWLDCLNDLANKNLQLSSKWCKNELTVDDLVTYTQDIGAEIASAPWRLIQALSQSTDDGGNS